MDRRIFITPKASQDIDEHFAYINKTNPDAALRFFDNVRQTIARLASMPGLGSPYKIKNQSLVGLRKWAVKGFENYLIFYVHQEEFLQVVRILYATRDLLTILEKEEG